MISTINTANIEGYRKDLSDGTKVVFGTFTTSGPTASSSIRFNVSCTKTGSDNSSTTSIANLSLPSNGSFLHDGADCSFSRTNTAYGTPAADSTCTFSTILNNNIGTVTSALSGSDKLSGLVWTPNRTGTAKICANIGMSGSGSGVTMSARLIDNAGLRIAENSVTTSTGTQAEPMYFCGLSNIDAAGAPLTYLVQTKATSGSVTVGLTQSIAIQWTITWESNGSPAPFLTGGQRSFQVNSAGTTVSSEVGGKVVSGCSSGGTGIVTCTPVGFTTALNCNCNPTGIVSTNDNTCFFETLTTSTIKYRTSNAGALANEAVSISCQGY
jgi:hypothetical protein